MASEVEWMGQCGGYKGSAENGSEPHGTGNGPLVHWRHKERSETVVLESSALLLGITRIPIRTATTVTNNASATTVTSNASATP